jgi:Flp pilus assembly protein TadG
MSIGMFVLCALVSLGVDYGRVQLAKTELQRAADAAARYAAAGLETSTSQARTRAIQAAGENRSDGAPVILQNADITFGRWNFNSRNFQPLPPANPNINAVRINALRDPSRSNAIPLMFGAVIGKTSFSLSAVATAVYHRPVQIDLAVPASSNPWLAGMPDGTLANPTPTSTNIRRDRAGPYTDPNGVFHPNGESPSQFTGAPLMPGEALNFDAIAGTGQHGPTQTVVGPDGNTQRIQTHRAGAEHGKSSLTAPIDSVVGVFLDDSIPSGPTPANLDFTTAASRDFTSFSPQLRQVFFIGDGRTSTGTVQQFIVPTGATRLFIGKMDGFEWNNNLGVSTITVHKPGWVSLVK